MLKHQMYDAKLLCKWKKIKMRTTLDIDDDVLQAAREIARRKGMTMGQVVSELSRQALTRPVESETRNGIPLFPRKPDGEIVTLELVNELRDEIA
jgi:antitoxin component of RelBE/YafQ-DinJ toxin-antitoxin module